MRLYCLLRACALSAEVVFFCCYSVYCYGGGGGAEARFAATA